jgi:hypothetical protein
MCCFCCSLFTVSLLAALYGVVAIIPCNGCELLAEESDERENCVPPSQEDLDACEAEKPIVQMTIGAAIVFTVVSMLINCASIYFGCGLKGKIDQKVVIIAKPPSPPTTTDAPPQFSGSDGEPVKADAVGANTEAD